MTAAQTDWLELLEPAQLSYIMQQSSAMGMKPFEVAIGLQPRTPLNVLVSEQPGRNLSLTAYTFVNSRQDLLDDALDNLEKASRRINKYAEKGRRTL